MADDVCKASIKAIARELDTGDSEVDPRPCLNSLLAADERFDKYANSINMAASNNDRVAWSKAYSDYYRDMVGPKQTDFWKSVNNELSPKGLCHLELDWSKEFPGIAESTK